MSTGTYIEVVSCAWIKQHRSGENNHTSHLIDGETGSGCSISSNIIPYLVVGSLCRIEQSNDK